MGEPAERWGGRWLFPAVLIGLCALAWGLRVWSPFAYVIRSSDMVSYIQIGINLANGEGFSDGDPFLRERTAWRAPLTPLVFGACYKLSGRSPEKAESLFFGLQQFLGTLILLFTVLAALEIHGSRLAALLAGALVAFDPAGIDLANKVLSETIFIVLTMAALYVSMRAFRQARGALFALAGILTGLALLSRAVLTLYLAGMILYLGYDAAVHPSRRGKRAGAFLLFLFASLAVLTPWVIRNCQANRTFTLVTTNTGFNLWVDNAAHGEDVWGELRILDEGEWAGLTEGQRDRILLKRALAYIAQNPVQYLGHIGRRLLLMASEFQKVLLFFAVGFILVQRRYLFRNLPALLLLGSLVATYALTMFNDRLGATLTPLVLIYAAYGMVELVRWIAGRLRSAKSGSENHKEESHESLAVP